MVVRDLAVRLGFDASEFRKGLASATKDMEKLVQRGIGQRAGALSALSGPLTRAAFARAAGLGTVGGASLGVISGSVTATFAALRAAENRARAVQQTQIEAGVRDVGSVSFGGVRRRDVTDIAIQDEIRDRAAGRFGRAAAPFTQNLRGARTSIAAGFSDFLGGLITPYVALLRRIEGLPAVTRNEQRQRDEQLAARHRQMNAIKQSNRTDIQWEIR